MFKKMITRAIAVTLALPILIATPLRASAADAIPDNSEWNAFVEEKIEKDDPPGLAVTLVNGSDVSFKNWRYANIKEKTPVTEDTVFGIASCSKAFTALSVYLLQEEGKLSFQLFLFHGYLIQLIFGIYPFSYKQSIRLKLFDNPRQHIIFSLFLFQFQIGISISKDILSFL